jgi:hypothetical protein
VSSVIKVNRKDDANKSVQSFKLAYKQHKTQ